MKQIYAILQRLKKPSVILSIVSQILSILMLTGLKVDNTLIMTIATTACSVFVTLGILSNPDTQNDGYSDDILKCENCGEDKKHVLVNGQLVCEGCGTPHKEEENVEANETNSDNTSSDSTN